MSRIKNSLKNCYFYSLLHRTTGCLKTQLFWTIGSAHHYRRSYEQAIHFHEQVLRISQEIGERTIEAKAYAGLGHAARCMGDLLQAKRWHERQLDIGLATKDRLVEGQACSNLGIIYQLLGELSIRFFYAEPNIANKFMLQFWGDSTLSLYTNDLFCVLLTQLIC